MKIKFVFLAFIFLIQNLLGMDLIIQTNIESILSTNKLYVTIKKGKLKAIYKDNLSFSFDNALIQIESWRATSEAEENFISSFRSNQDVFLNSFDVELDLKFLTDDKIQLAEKLKNTNLYFSCFVLDQKERTRPRTLVVCLNDLNINNLKNINENNELPLTFTYASPLMSFTNSIDKLFTLTTQADYQMMNGLKRNQICDDVKIEKTKKFGLSKIDKNILLGICILLILLAFFCFVPFIQTDSKFRFLVGVVLLCIALPILIKIFLIYRWWPFY